MPHLDDRLRAVAQQIRSRVHADIGSDHGYLLKALLSAGRIERGIAIENKLLPLQNSQATLRGTEVDVRFADGLEGLKPGEADSLSICGMGGEAIVRILDRFPDRVAAVLVLQPNRQPEAVRQWGLRSRFALVDEQMVWGQLPYTVLRFERAKSNDDRAYDGVDREAAILLGPWILRRGGPELHGRLREELEYLQSFEQLNVVSRRRLKMIDKVLSSNGFQGNKS